MKTELLTFFHLHKHLILLLVASMFIGFGLLLLFRIKSVCRVVKSIAKDILKQKQPDGTYRWSLIRCMQLAAFGSCFWAFHYTMLHEKFNDMLFYALLFFAVMGQVPDAWSKKINPNSSTPDENKQ